MTSSLITCARRNSNVGPCLGCMLPYSILDTTIRLESFCSEKRQLCYIFGTNLCGTSCARDLFSVCFFTWTYPYTPINADAMYSSGRLYRPRVSASLIPRDPPHSCVPPFVLSVRRKLTSQLILLEDRRNGAGPLRRRAWRASSRRP